MFTHLPRSLALASGLLLAGFAFGAASGPALAFSLPHPASGGAPLTLVNCAFNGPNCVTGKYPNMNQELQNEANLGLDVPTCQGDCNQFGFIPDAASVKAPVVGKSRDGNERGERERGEGSAEAAACADGRGRAAAPVRKELSHLRSGRRCS